MDDIQILAAGRWKLKTAIRILNETVDELKRDKYPEKTSVGRIECSFYFRGYRFKPEGLTLAKKTITNFITKALRLYEQKPPPSKPPNAPRPP